MVKQIARSRIQVTYNARPGVYTVSLTVYESDGGSDTMTKADYITVIEVNEPPVSNQSGPYTGTEGVAIDYDGSGSYDPDGSIVAYELFHVCQSITFWKLQITATNTHRSIMAFRDQKIDRSEEAFFCPQLTILNWDSCNF